MKRIANIKNLACWKTLVNYGFIPCKWSCYNVYSIGATLKTERGTDITIEPLFYRKEHQWQIVQRIAGQAPIILFVGSKEIGWNVRDLIKETCRKNHSLKF